MKKVIQKQQKETVNLNDITNDSIVGIKWKDQERNFMVYCEKGYISLNNELTSEGRYGSKTKKSYLKEAINKMGATAYVFNTTKELYKWLSK